ncbi:MAG: guanylate kinase [Bergeyella sp.]|nr:guanylate kinase [Bergeyella sp.]
MKKQDFLKGKVIIFAAPSGSGKTTLVRHVLEVIPELCFSVSCTTRAPRREEKHGRDYYFLSPEVFREKISADAFVEYEEVYPDQFYGTLWSEVENIWEQDKIVIFDVDVKGAISLKNIFGSRALSLFISPPSVEELKRRLINRNTDSAKSIEIRARKAAKEMKYKNSFDAVIINENLDRAKAEAEKKIREFLDR